MHYTIYKTTCLKNSKFYIGKHQTKNLDDGYLGSGKLLKHAIKKYGIENFKKEILETFSTEAEMNAAEKRLVIICDQSYNLCEGGHGGFGFINQNGSSFKGRKHSKETKTRIASKLIGVKISEDALRNRNYKINPNAFLGQHHDEETKKRISNSLKGKIPWNKGLRKNMSA